MSYWKFAGAAVIAAALGSALQAEEVKSGIQEGGRVGTYSTTKCAGAEDGVKVGQSLCYT